MQLNKFTDYALRLLMYIAQPKEMPYTIAEIAADLHVSQNHLVKIVHFMGKQNWLITTRGKGGGIRLNPQALTLPLGEIVRILQRETPIVECNTPPCVLRSSASRPILANPYIVVMLILSVCWRLRLCAVRIHRCEPSARRPSGRLPAFRSALRCA